ncbi:MAG: hypothetical protein U1F25_01765 [Rubrivivax sp.]
MNHVACRTPAARARAATLWARRRLLLLAAALGWAATAPVLANDDLPEGAQELRSAVVAVGDGPEFPVTPVQAVTLPDDWTATRPGFQGTVWYRVQMEFDPLAGEWRSEGAAAP